MTLQEDWINLLHRAATGTKRTRTLLTPIGAMVFGLFTVLFVLAAVSIDRWFNLPAFLPQGARLAVSIPLMVLGMAITLWSAIHFLKVKGTPVPTNPPPQVVDSGPYQYARNPMLSGIFLILFGLGCYLNSVALVFVFTPLFVLVNLWELKKIEEPELIKRLEDAYLEYHRRTPMFIPRRRS